MKTKRILFLIAPLAIALNSVSCNSGGGGGGGGEDIKFTQILDKQPTLTIDANGSKEINVDKNLADNNYLKLLVKSNASKGFTGQFVYSNLDNPSEIVSEDFYVEKGNDEIDFRQFLDAFRTEDDNGELDPGEEPHPMSKGVFKKKLVKIVINNINAEPINVDVNGLFMSDRVVPSEDKEIYLTKDNLKVGMDLAAGGTFTHLEKLSVGGSTVNEYITDENTVSIGVGDEGKEKLSDKVNLINIWDAGRQIQQSYYASVGGYGKTEEERKDRNNKDGGTQNGYTRRTAYTADSEGYYWPYNPVQGGDELCDCSQIIDYHATEDELYCKTRALDWAAGKKNVDRKGNRVTKSYIETWITIKDGLAYVHNRFIDWNGFNIDDDVPSINMEIPATYVVHPLNNYYCYNGDNPFDSQEIKSRANLDVQPKLGSWSSGSYHSDKHTENWFAWLNEDVNAKPTANPFGVAVYIPGITKYYASGRSDASTSIDIWKNNDAYESPMYTRYLYNKDGPTSKYCGAYVFNTDYTAPIVTVKMKEYIAFEYQYVVAVDYLNAFRSKFKKIHEEGSVDSLNQAGLTAWDN